MRFHLIVNTNRIIAALIKNSISRKLLYDADIEFLGIYLSQKEVQKYRNYIMKKAKITPDEFDMLLSSVYEKIIFIEDDLLLTKADEAMQIMFKIDPDDVQFIAAAIATNADIWSDDPHFLRQKKIKVWRTKDLVNML